MGGILAVSIGVTEDLAMLVAGVVGSAMILYRDAKRNQEVVSHSSAAI
jgi:hypothetical protein